VSAPVEPSAFPHDRVGNRIPSRCRTVWPLRAAFAEGVGSRLRGSRLPGGRSLLPSLNKDRPFGSRGRRQACRVGAAQHRRVRRGGPGNLAGGGRTRRGVSSSIPFPRGSSGGASFGPGMDRPARALSSDPSAAKREPWQRHSHVRSADSHPAMRPRWGQCAENTNGPRTRLGGRRTFEGGIDDPVSPP
jgi:hypothetical protein